MKKHMQNRLKLKNKDGNCKKKKKKKNIITKEVCTHDQSFDEQEDFLSQYVQNIHMRSYRNVRVE